MHHRNMVDFGIIIICVLVYLITYSLLRLFLFSFFITCTLSFPLSITLLHFQAGCHKRRLILHS